MHIKSSRNWQIYGGFPGGFQCYQTLISHIYKNVGDEWTLLYITVLHSKAHSSNYPAYINIFWNLLGLLLLLFFFSVFSTNVLCPSSKTAKKWKCSIMVGNNYTSAKRSFNRQLSSLFQHFPYNCGTVKCRHGLNSVCLRYTIVALLALKTEGVVVGNKWRQNSSAYMLEHVVSTDK